ncbi:hypothetical protein JHK85_050979 [Glycine max]|nr:hypothetical protein JHK85_050979 [Glycine max]
MREWFAFRLQCKSNEAQTLLHSRKLFQQFVVEGYTMVEPERLSFIRNNQKKLRVDKFCSLQKSLDVGTTKGLNRSKRVILPSTFVGSPRYNDQLYFDGMRICSHVGFPNLFITLTCNPNWPEIRRLLTPLNLKATDKPDIISRVFKLKYEQRLSNLTKNHLLGKVVACIINHATTQNNEIKEYLDCRYISPCEATWRIFGFPIHGRKPAIERLHFHLPGQHSVLYQDHDDIDDVMSKPSISDSNFISWMNNNQSFVEGRILMHNLFLNTMNKPEEVWDQTWHWLANDIAYHRRKTITNTEIHLNDDHLKNLVLLEIEQLLQTNQKSLRDYPSMSYPEDGNWATYLDNSLILSELNYNNDEQHTSSRSTRDYHICTVDSKHWRWNYWTSNDGYATMEIPQDLLITEYDDPIHGIVNSTFPDLCQHHNNP